MSIDPATIDTYDRSAEEFSAHFKGYKGHELVKELEIAFKLAGNPRDARIVEIGCGAGKDAVAIAKRASWYEGFDPSKELLTIAQRELPGVSFVQSNAVDYLYPDDLDIVFAFASMLHLDKDDFSATCRKILQALRPGGVFCMTLKEAREYTSQLQRDDFGERLFYLYNSDLVQELAGPNFSVAYEDHYAAGPKHKPWFSIILRKQRQGARIKLTGEK
jgi:SAM-dependent methyltransferase